MALQIALVLALFLFAYPFALYPALLRVLPARRRTPALAGDPPPLAFIICALNEEKVIRAKVENCLALDYPPGRLRTIVVSDGSTDATAAIVREYEGRGIQLIERPQRRGKVTNLNEVAQAVPEPFVAFSDANVMYHPQALRHLMGRFADPTVGCATGKVVLTGTTEDISQSEASYYSLEWSMQETESGLHSMVGVDGAMYAMRRDLFRPCPADTLIEDFVMGMEVVRQGFRVVLEPQALAWETGPTSLREEARRKIRIAAGAAQALARGNGVPGGQAPPPYWFIWASHKLLRWLSPFIGLAALLLAAFSPGWPLSQLVLAGTAALTLLALVRLLTGRHHPLLNAPFYFLFGQTMLAWGFVKGLAGRQSVLWAKANR